MLKLREGDLVRMEARYPENLKRVRAGDTVAITYTLGVAMKLEPAGT